jgi:hypothetical protein
MSDNSKDSKEEKQLKREARDRWEASRAVAATGDYRRLRALDRQLIELAPATASAEQARVELSRLTIDRFAIYVGGGALVLYVVAWIASLA